MGLNWLAPIQKELVAEDNGNILLITKNRNNMKELIRSLKEVGEDEKVYNIKAFIIGSGNTYTGKKVVLDNIKEYDTNALDLGFSPHFNLEHNSIKKYLEDSGIKYGTILLDKVLPDMYAVNSSNLTEEFFTNTLQIFRKYLVKNGRLILNDRILKPEHLTQHIFNTDISLELSDFLRLSRYSKIGRPNIRRTKQGIKVNGGRDKKYIYSTDQRTIQEFLCYLEDSNKNYEKVYGVYNILNLYTNKGLNKVYHKEYGEFKGLEPAYQTTVLVKK